MPPDRLVNWPWASRIRVVFGSAERSAYPGAAGSESGRRERHGAPTSSTPGTIWKGVVSVSTVTWSGACASHWLEVHNDPGSSASWLPGSSTTGTGIRLSASHARRIVCRSTWLCSNTSPVTTTNAAPVRSATSPIRATASSRA